MKSGVSIIGRDFTADLQQGGQVTAPAFSTFKIYTKLVGDGGVPF
jgi:hypothetical protein